MSKKPTEQESESLQTFSFVKNYLADVFKELNPWNNIRIMHTNIGQDILAGIVVAIIALPLALAFGVGSGLGAISGIWGAIAGGIVGGLFGGSRFGVSGPTGPKMVQLAAIMVGYRLASGDPDLGVAFAIVFFSGIILIVISMLRLSRLIYFTPYSVVAGFMCGIGLIVMFLEFDSFMGSPAPHSVMEAIKDIPMAISNASPQALMVSIPTLAILFLWPSVTRKVSQLKMVPGPLIALILGTGISIFGNFDIEYIGEVPTGLPNLYFPDWSRFGEFFIPALSLAGLAVFDSLLTCVVADQMTGDKHSSDRESFGQGMANIAAGLVGGVTTATATMRTVSNIQSGGKTPLAAIVHGLVLLALVLGLAPLAEHIPMACLAAILFKVGIDILDYRIMPVLHRLPLTDMLVFWTVLIVTIVEDLLYAMGIGILLAFVRFVQEMSRMYEHQLVYLDDVDPDASNGDFSKTLGKKIKVLRPQGPMFFGSVKPLVDAYEKADEHNVLIVNLKNVPMMDLSGAYALEDLIIKARDEGKEVFICGASVAVKKVLKSVKVLDRIGQKGYFESKQDAIDKARQLDISGTSF